MLRAARLGTTARALFLGGGSHVVCPPCILIAAGRVVQCASACNILYLAGSHALSSRIDLVRHARAIQRMLLVFRVLWWPVLAEPAVAFSIVLNCHVHPVLHFKLCLLLPAKRAEQFTLCNKGMSESEHLG